MKVTSSPAVIFKFAGVKAKLEIEMEFVVSVTESGVSDAGMVSGDIFVQAEKRNGDRRKIDIDRIKIFMIDGGEGVLIQLYKN